jgi:predicted phage terminase large subunit-like protein
MTLPELTDEELAALTPEEQAEYHEDYEAAAGGESLRDFVTRMSPHHPPPRHFDPVIEELETCRAKRRRICISMPPRHGKTTLLVNAFAWWLSKNPADTNAYYSYNAPQAYSKSVLARALSSRAGVELSDETNTKAEWRTTDGGGLLAGGVGGGLTGQGVSGLLVVDDPFKGPVDAYSQVYRDAVDDWFKTVPMTRLEGASVFVIHTRWHEDDLIGRLAKANDFRVINLPAIAKEGDLLGRPIGEALWPERFPVEDLLATKKIIGEYNFASLYDGAPRPRGGKVFGEPHYYDPETTDFTGCRFILAGDPAASEKTSADYSAAVVLSVRGFGDEAVAYVRKVYREQVAIPKYVDDLVSLQHTFGNTKINIEAVGGFKAVPQMLRALNQNLRIVEIEPVGDKFTRAQPVGAAWNAGRVLVPADSPPWLGAFLDELEKFTGVNDAYDDQVDALAHAWNSIKPPQTAKPSTAGARRAGR